LGIQAHPTFGNVNTSVPESVHAEVSSNGADEKTAAAEIVEAPLPMLEKAVPEETPRMEALTEREAWLIDVVATGVAWHLAETFRSLSDVTTIKNCIVAKVEMAAGVLSTARHN
jgi:prophage DNA circulation protein